MTTSTALTVIPAINTLESEGSALAEMYKKEQTSLKKKFTQSIKMDQLSYRLGKLLDTLSAEAEGGRIKSKRLAEVGIANIDKRRRSEALWFYQNYDKATAFIKASKKGFTSLTALQSAMKKADKSNVGPSTEGNTEGSTATDSVDDLLPSNTTFATANDLADAVVAIATERGIDLQQVVELLIDSATSTEVEIEERKVA
tara:strand:- start:334 stop:933 length:600 start_codon:yes stop_codon:yes gene_type:complete